MATPPPTTKCAVSKSANTGLALRCACVATGSATAPVADGAPRRHVVVRLLASGGHRRGPGSGSTMVDEDACVSDAAAAAARAAAETVLPLELALEGGQKDLRRQ